MRLQILSVLAAGLLLAACSSDEPVETASTQGAGSTTQTGASVARNVALATDRHSRRTLRQSLRSRLERSPLMNAPSFTRGLEEGFRTMWRNGRLI